MEWDFKRGIDPETGIAVRIPRQVGEDTIGVEEKVVTPVSTLIFSS
jgi:hypothetical protein